MARCLALLGMVATHVLDARTATGELSFGQSLASGRASALFAVLAGVSIALVTGRSRPLRGTRRARASAGLAVRAVLVAALGLALAEVDSGIAVILTYYGLMFLLVLPFLGLSARALAGLATTWVVAAPVLSHWLRTHLPERGFDSPSWNQLVEDPSGLVAELTFTGYYPAVPWLAYLLVGMAVGRIDLSTRRTAIALASLGATLAVVATGVSRALTARADIGRALLADLPAQDATSAALVDRISEGLPGTTPTGGAWEWLLTVAPHSATPFDLAQTIGSALAVIGLALLAVSATSGVVTRSIALFFGAGTMTLSLYSLHVLLRSRDLLPDGLRDSYPFHAVVLLGIGLAFVAAARRGPLERVVGAAAHLATGSPRVKS